MEIARVDTELCDGCGTCAELCCVEAIEIVDGKAVVGPDCILCMACAAVCSQNAILEPLRPPHPIQVPPPRVPFVAAPLPNRRGDSQAGALERFAQWLNRSDQAAPASPEEGAYPSPGRRPAGQGRGRGGGHGRGRGMRGAGRGRGMG